MSKPNPSAPDCAALPKALAPLRIWFTWNWRWNSKDKRWVKYPHAWRKTSDGKCMDASLWRVLSEIELNGNGLAMALGGKLCGIDLDHCILKSGELASWAKPIVERFDSYTEISPSGDGLKITFWSTEDLRLSRKRGDKTTQGWEIAFFTWGRWWAMTGKVWQKMNQLRTIDADTLREFHDELTAGKFDVAPKPNGNDHQAQESSGGDQSESGKDWAYIHRLAEMFSNNPDMIELEFRRTRPYRKKWDEPRGKRTYLTETIRKVIEEREQKRNAGAAGAAPKPEDSPFKSHTPAEWPQPLDPKALHGLPGDIVHALEPYSEADPAAHLAQLLIAFGNAIGRGPYFQVEDDRHFSNEFVALVGPTSKARKGTSWSPIRRMFEECDPGWAHRVMPGLSSGEGVVHMIRDPRGEGEDAEAGEIDKRLMVVEPELASVIAMIARQGNTLSPILRQAWDSGRLGNMTKKTSETCAEPHISLLGHITEEELRRSLDRTELANGFANRFMFICVRRSKLLPDGGRMPDQHRQQLVGRLKTALSFARGVGEMTRDARAKEKWREVYGPLSDGRSGLFGAIVGRAEAHAMRLSCLYALLNLSPIVSLDHLDAALAFWTYSEDSAMHIFSDATGDPIADAILSVLRNNPDGLTRTEISELFNRNQSKARIDVALAALRSQGRAHTVKRMLTGGGPAEIWLARFTK